MTDQLPALPAQRGVVHLAHGFSMAERVTALVLAGTAGLALVIASLWPVSSVNAGPSMCVFMNATGLPCPGCGMTRSWVHLAHGDVGAAFSFNHFGPLLMLVAVAIVLYVVVAVLRRRPPEGVFQVLPTQVLALGVALWIGYSVARMVSLGLGQQTFAAVLG